MTEECEMTWLSLVENCVSAAANQGCVQIVIFLVRFACGPTAPHALKAVQLQLGSAAVAWEAQGKQGYHFSS